MAADSSAVLAQPHGDTLGNYVEQQYGSNEFLDLSDASIQYRLEQMKDQIRKEIRKELKIKEGAENMRKVTTDKKSLANVNNMVKQANARLQELQQELNELNARIVVNTDNTGPSPELQEDSRAELSHHPNRHGKQGFTDQRYWHCMFQGVMFLNENIAVDN
ncbi:serine/threonine-protein kinase N2-like [Diadema antillarum]|uniref:serine/threonine-protein kinase N2-like n=1 Tax=Diadema antillarum TaxID=105358 RepID=UPI003A85F42F